MSDFESAIEDMKKKNLRRQSDGGYKIVKALSNQEAVRKAEGDGDVSKD